MLFGRKTPPAAPKADIPVPPQPGVRPYTPGEPGAVSSPLASLNNPVPGGNPVSAAAAHASGMAPSMAHALADTQHASPAYPDMPSASKGPDMNSIPKPPTAPSVPGAGFKPDVPRRVVDMPGSAPRQPSIPVATPAAAPIAQAPVQAPIAPAMPEQRRLTVGRDISLTGEIGSCDVLVVEGTVEAKLREGRSVEIAESGLFKGSVEIEEADIAGRFEGDISVRGRLTVRSTGKITGSIRFGELAVEAGGQLVGDIQLYSAGSKPAAAPIHVQAPIEQVPAAEAV
ncbi:polymer-forming cytoskeletal protein [Azospirillum sp. YIM B02556]|uniref:Polymer-forming cytoskeletal protein n=1 Tax=Azospirillum endophyticum TaxID=2800326 RepID=A0ABS1FG41_9PROT|nr:polymer-forming cytoskeletal protein [Azospirillum endophyticum]MBK1842406.1 polymer-forming cytoskeletal protein [Azospirillum endophyticum]